MNKNSDIYDAISEAIDATVAHFVKEDPYYYIAPYLSQMEIGKDCPFFADNRITLIDTDIASEDLKTMSYLATFYRDKIAYSPKNIDYYLRALGHLSHNESGMDIVCYENVNCTDPLITEIPYSEWLLLDGEYTTTYNMTIEAQTAIVGEALAYAES